MLKWISLLCILIFRLPSAISLSTSDEIISLPGLNEHISFKHYSGYLNGTKDKFLHYWFTESARDPANDPLVLWMNGGPGCSSLDGLLNELGPYLVSSDGQTLSANIYSWNNFANVLFLEAPACVGFSYDTNKDCQTGDDATSLDNYLAIQHFYKKFPEFRSNELFITGESYAGVYVPTLTLRLLDGNDTFAVNLKGFAVGNGLSSIDLNDDSIIFFAYYHGLIGPELWSKLVSSCCKQGEPSQESCDFSQPIWPRCRIYVQEAMDIIFNQGLNMYNLYGACVNPSLNNGTSRYTYDAENLFRGIRKLTWMTSGTNRLPPLSLDPPCTDSLSLRTYLNNKDVRKALHIPEFVSEWDVCNDEVNYNYKSEYTTMKDQYHRLTQKIRGLVYNGDVDMACNFLGDSWFAESLGLKVLKERRMWHEADQVAGFVKQFQNLDVVTIRGAGHMVPQDKPGPALNMIGSFLFGKNY